MDQSEPKAKCGAKSRLSERRWENLFRKDAQGVPRKVLAKQYGVTVGTIAWQARKRARLKGQVAGAVDRRRRPAEGWDRDHVFTQSRSGMTPRLWEDCLQRYLGGEATDRLARIYGVSVGAIQSNAKRLRMRKTDVPGAVYRPRGGAAAWPINTYLTQVKMDFHDALAMRDSFGEAMIAAIRADDWNAVRELMRVQVGTGRMATWVEYLKQKHGGYSGSFY
uniref:hypothetical protein n=1 Tax=Brevundimonas sp. TaxID=1871086 RepID=UPI0040346D4B